MGSRLLLSFVTSLFITVSIVTDKHTDCVVRRVSYGLEIQSFIRIILHKQYLDARRGGQAGR